MKLKNITNHLRHRHAITALPAALLIIVLLIPNIVLCFTEQQHMLTGTSNILLPAAFYCLLLSLDRNTGRTMLLMLPLIFLAAFQLVLLYLFGNGIISVDMYLNLVTTNASEAFELLNNIAAGVAAALVLYVPLLVWAAMLVHRKARMSPNILHRFRKAATALFAAAVPFVAAAYASVPSFAIKYDIFPANVCYNMYLAAERMYHTARYEETSRKFRFNAVATHKDTGREAYVLVIGETSRADNWQLFGYSRATNPLLSHTGGLVAFPLAFSQSNTTHKSVPMLLSPVSATEFNDIYRTKSIITAFKEAGFRTAFYSNQQRNRSFIDFFGMEADTCVFIRDGMAPGTNSSDMRLLEYVANELTRHDGNIFIVLHTYGSHFKYNERYGRGDSYFKPDTNMKAGSENKKQLVNAYDNTIRLTDKMLYSLTRLLETNAARSAALYTSDHGEDLYDNGSRAFMHSSPVPSYYQLHVPLLIWMSPGYEKAYPNIRRNLERNSGKFVATSASVFHTMMDIAGISTPYYDGNHSPASTHYMPVPLYFLDDHNKPRTMQEIRFTACDRALFRSVHVE